MTWRTKMLSSNLFGYLERLLLVFLFAFGQKAQAWTVDDMELFDLVEEIGENFYTFLGLPENADTNEVKKKFRKLSLQFHPDKNSDPGAGERFRKIVAVAEILKDDDRRKKYDSIIQNGLPDWKQPVYYYRRVRKMGCFELFAFLVTLLTVGQYLLAWSAYLEKKNELEEIFLAKYRRKTKKSKKSTLQSTEEPRNLHCNLEKPKCQDLLIVRLAYFLIYLIIHFPSHVQYLKDVIQERMKPVQEIEESSVEEILPGRERKPKKKLWTVPDASEVASPHVDLNEEGEVSQKNTSEEPSKPWTDEDTQLLKRAMKKFPVGTTDRWQTIADFLGHSQSQVLAAVKHLKSATPNMNVLPGVQGVTGAEYESPFCNISQADVLAGQSKKKQELGGIERTLMISQQQPSGDGNSSKSSQTWSQPQQKALEMALQQHPKGSEERWDKIAAAVPGKSKEECIIRYKSLVDTLKKKKAEKAS